MDDVTSPCRLAPSAARRCRPLANSLIISSKKFPNRKSKFIAFVDTCAAVKMRRDSDGLRPRSLGDLARQNDRPDARTVWTQTEHGGDERTSAVVLGAVRPGRAKTAGHPAKIARGSRRRNRLADQRQKRLVLVLLESKARGVPDRSASQRSCVRRCRSATPANRPATELSQTQNTLTTAQPVRLAVTWSIPALVNRRRVRLLRIPFQKDC